MVIYPTYPSGIAAGVFFIFFYVINNILKTTLDSMGSLFLGLTLLGVGSASAVFWRAVREIHRNPSLIYFEQTMEKLNVYWLIVSACYSVQFIANWF